MRTSSITYDFYSEIASSSNVDWPVTMVFYGHAEVDRVKMIYFGWANAHTMYARMSDDGYT